MAIKSIKSITHFGAKRLRYFLPNPKFIKTANTGCPK